MDVREKMLKLRDENDISLQTMSNRTGVSAGLISMIEGGFVTHPDIARKLQDGYGLTDEETEMLMPEIHRKSSPNYEPDKYKDLSISRQVVPVPYTGHDEIDLYKNERIKKEH